MDRFNLRVWNKKTKEYVNPMDWSYWDLCFWYEPYKQDIEPVLMDMDYYEIEQSTGLKDKNGNLIYEGDILKNNFTTAMYEVVFRKAGFYFRLYFKRCNEIIDYLPPDENLASATEIIGNIHEDKDLLEVE